MALAKTEGRPVQSLESVEEQLEALEPTAAELPSVVDGTLKQLQSGQLRAPLRKLAELYRSAGRTEELLGLYETHLAQYPQDAGAALVLARLYSEFKDRRAPEFWKQVVGRFPNDAALYWFNAKFLEEKHDPKSADEMARAVAL